MSTFIFNQINRLAPKTHNRVRSPFDTFGQRLLRASSFAGAQGLTTQLKQEIPIPPLPIGQERHIARLLDDLTQETHGFFKKLAVFPSTVHLPQKAGRSIHQHDRPSLGLLWRHILVDACIQLIPFDHLLYKLMGQSKQQRVFLSH